VITITAFDWVPPAVQGLMRDLRVRWALEEAGLAYRTRFITGRDQNSAEYRARQPFGQVPIFEEDGFVLFESGAIVLHIGARSEALLPRDEAVRARATSWLIAALNSIEVVVQQLVELDLFHADEAWARHRRPDLERASKRRLEDLAAWLADRAFLEDRFTAGDLMMASVLRSLRHTDLVEGHPTLSAYLARCEARPAFLRAERDHMAAFETH
jgi:glutathione S-transferase